MKNVFMTILVKMRKQQQQHRSLLKAALKNYQKDLYYKSPHENIGLQEVHSIIQKRTI